MRQLPSWLCFFVVGFFLLKPNPCDSPEYTRSQYHISFFSHFSFAGNKFLLLFLDCLVNDYGCSPLYFNRFSIFLCTLCFIRLFNRKQWRNRRMGLSFKCIYRIYQNTRLGIKMTAFNLSICMHLMLMAGNSKYVYLQCIWRYSSSSFCCCYLTSYQDWCVAFEFG